MSESLRNYHTSICCGHTLSAGAGADARKLMVAAGMQPNDEGRNLVPDREILCSWAIIGGMSALGVGVLRLFVVILPNYMQNGIASATGGWEAACFAGIAFDVFFAVGEVRGRLRKRSNPFFGGAGWLLYLFGFALPANVLAPTPSGRLRPLDFVPDILVRCAGFLYSSCNQSPFSGWSPGYSHAFTACPAPKTRATVVVPAPARMPLATKRAIAVNQNLGEVP